MNLVAAVRDLIRQESAGEVFRAVVTGTSGNLVTIQRTGQASADTQSYPKLASYSSPSVNDEVIALMVGGTPVILGKLSR